MGQFLTGKQVDWITERAAQQSFQAAVRKLQAQGSGILDRDVVIPDRQAGYYHDYFCPDHAVQLVFDLDAPTVHRCPHDGRLFSGEPYDSARDWFVNNRLSEGARALGLLWTLTRDRRYLNKAEEILMRYAQRYVTYPPAPSLHPANPGKVTWSCLDESVWAIAVTWTFDLIRDAVSQTAAGEIERRLLRPAAEVIAEHMYRNIHNVACWNIAAIGTIGLALGDEDLIRFAIDGELGFHRQMEKGVFDDGLWFEGSLSYHYYTLGGLMALAQAAQSTTHDIRGHGRLRSMFEGPILCAYPDLSLPAINDCWYFISLLGECGHGIPPAAAFHEVAYAWYGGEMFADVLRQTYAQTERDTAEALLFGVDELPPYEKGGRASRLESVNLEPSGYAVLRSRTDAQCYAILKYGPYADSHDHPDKLNLILFANGERMSPDLGTPGYGIELNETWYRQTVSHNTVVIDGTSQGPCSGTLRRFVAVTEDGLSIADASACWNEGTYAGVTMRRAVLWRDGYFVDVFSVACDRPRQIDWVYHNLGGFESTPEIAACSGVLQDGIGYDCIEQVRRRKVDGDVTLSWQTAASRLDVFLLGSSGSEVITGLGPFNPAFVRIPMVIARRVARHATFVSVFLPSQVDTEARGRVRRLDGDLDEDGFVRFVVDHAGAEELWNVRTTAAGRATTPTTVRVDKVFAYELLER